MNNKSTAAFAAFFLLSTASFAQIAPNLGTADPFALLGTNSSATSGTVTCTGPGTINGNVGSTFNTITNMGPPCTINGTITAPVAASVAADFDTAYAQIDGQNPVCNGVIPSGTPIVTLTPGVYCSAAGTTLTAGAIITLSGTATDVWIFRVGTTGTGALSLTDAQVIMGGTAQACNVFWRTAEGATTTSSAFVGTVLAGTSITMTDGTWVGRALANMDVTITRAVPFTFAGCAPAALSALRQVPTLSEWAMILLATLLAVSGFAAMRSRAR